MKRQAVILSTGKKKEENDYGHTLLHCIAKAIANKNIMAEM